MIPEPDGGERLREFGWVVVYPHPNGGGWAADATTPLSTDRSEAVRTMNALRADGVDAHIARVGERCDPHYGSCTHPSGHEGRHDQNGPFTEEPRP